MAVLWVTQGVLCGGGLHLEEVDARHDDLHRLRDRRVGPAPRPDGVRDGYSAVPRVGGQQRGTHGYSNGYSQVLERVLGVVREGSGRADGSITGYSGGTRAYSTTGLGMEMRTPVQS